ncbi:DUF4190 domain-containing protein [Nesterenkonia natronophila]|uniref:DUF4190 domain-containing protein n=1 Tax=Nesterenkonia natronophila TaxID=2174932 RepID=A0A3A4FYP6_9MICC|nr:DUF4190 domain-containing protein [Nesterenkonia natronophila]RJN31159.1 DUF4190 domain-containing protein [Nesterenkonia natronophila]
MAESYYPYYPEQAAPPAPKGIGIAAMVLGIISVVLAFIPVLGLVSFLLGPLAVILGIVAIVKHRGEGQGIAGVITGAIGTIFAIAGLLIAGAFLSSMDDEVDRLEDEAGSVDPDHDEEVAELEEEVQEQQEEIAEEREEPEDDGVDEDSAPDADEGTRENPLPLGQTVSDDEWEVTLHSVAEDVDDQIAEENQFNDPAPDGLTYVLVNMSATYLGEGSDSPMMAVELAYVSSTGETTGSYDHTVVTPDSFDDFAELYTGGTETGNVALAVPPGDDGTLRVRLGFLDTQDFFFEASE